MNETQKQIAAAFGRLEQELASLSAPFAVHLAQRQILSRFWQAIGQEQAPNSSSPQLPVDNQTTQPKCPSDEQPAS